MTGGSRCGSPSRVDSPIVKMPSVIERDGANYWFILHRFAECQPESEAIDAGACRHFIDSIVSLLPCAKCMGHARVFMGEEWDGFAQRRRTGTELRKFLFNFHNYVNRSVRPPKPQLSWGEYQTEAAARGPCVGPHRFRCSLPACTNCRLHSQSRHSIMLHPYQ